MTRLHPAADQRPRRDTPQEAVILRHANRLELYAVADDVEGAHESIVNFLSFDRDLPTGEFRDALYCLTGDDAVRHLMRVACGLESMIFGEPQVLGQVTGCLSHCPGAAGGGPFLNTLFQRAIRREACAHRD